MPPFNKAKPFPGCKQSPPFFQKSFFGTCGWGYIVVVFYHLFARVWERVLRAVCECVKSFCFCVAAACHGWQVVKLPWKHWHSHDIIFGLHDTCFAHLFTHGNLVFAKCMICSLCSICSDSSPEKKADSPQKSHWQLYHSLLYTDVNLPVWLCEWFCSFCSSHFYCTFLSCLRNPVYVRASYACFAHFSNHSLYWLNKGHI